VDPDGPPALRSVLKPGGAMHLMVYAPTRTGIYMLQEFSGELVYVLPTQTFRAL